MSPIFLIGAGVVLLGLGLGLGYWFAHIQRTREASRISDIQNELDDYRRHVSEHFSETAQHFQTIGQQYRSLYQHMAQGAEALCDPAQSDALLGFTTGNEPAATAGTVDEPADPPEMIRDYAPTEELESSPLEPVVDTPDTVEPLEEQSATDKKADEPSADEVVEDHAAAPTAIEEERTVH